MFIYRENHRSRNFLLVNDDYHSWHYRWNLSHLLPSFEKSLQSRLFTPNGEEGEVGNQDLHVPGIVPKIPGRFYVYFGKPIETKGREKELNDKESAHEVYLQVKSEVARCMAYLKVKRESDPYRNIFPRLLCCLSHGFTSQIPTFDLPDH